jgi:hypothetical protein
MATQRNICAQAHMCKSTSTHMLHANTDGRQVNRYRCVHEHACVKVHVGIAHYCAHQHMDRWAQIWYTDMHTHACTPSILLSASGRHSATMMSPAFPTQGSACPSVSSWMCCAATTQLQAQGSEHRSGLWHYRFREAQPVLS